MIDKDTKEDEKELLFFIEDEFERDEDTEIVDPCHQYLLRLLDRLLLVTAMFITAVIGTSITIAIVYSNAASSNLHSIDTTLKSDAPALPSHENSYVFENTVTLQDDDSRYEWNEIVLCSNLHRRSVLKMFESSSENWCNSNVFKDMVKNLLNVMSRNTSNIVSPLDESNPCDILHPSQPKVETILPNNDIIKSLYQNTCDDKDSLRNIISLLATQYDEEDAVVSIGDPTKHFVASVKNCSYSISSSSQERFIGTIERMNPFSFDVSQKICNTFKVHSSSINVHGFLEVPKQLEYDIVPKQENDFFNTRIILDAESYDQYKIRDSSFVTDANDVFYELQINGMQVTSNYSLKLQSVRVLPGYQTNVALDSCIQKEVVLGQPNLSNLVVNSTLQVSQNIEVNPWKMSLTESMIAFGRVGYRLQYICTEEMNLDRKRSLEEKYPNICKEIENITFKANGESNIAQAVFESETKNVASGANDILSYIKDNIAIVNIKLNFDPSKSCLS